MKLTRKQKVGVVTFLVCGLVLSGTINVNAAQYITKEQTVNEEQAVIIQRTKKNNKQKKVSEKTRNKYFSDAAFVGNSVSVGLKMYFDSQGKGFLGAPTMLVQGCYSFANDAAAHSQYQISYKGKKYKAKDAIKAAKVKKAFISMGTNDMGKPASQVYQDYVKYIQGIRKENPNVIIFIQSTTPMCTSKNRKYLNNSAINELNKLMKKYCNKHKDMYYVDISKDMKDKSGGLKKQYASDGYVHMTMAGYKVWTNNLTEYVDKLILQEQEATNAVEKAAKSRIQEDYDAANTLVKKLASSQKKDQLKKKLGTIHIVDTADVAEDNS